MLSFYDRLLVRTAGLPPPPEPPPLVGGTPPATPEAQARRAQRLALTQRRAPTLTPAQARRQLESREKALLRELQALEKELGTVRAQLAA
jgi:hypothetical protein